MVQWPKKMLRKKGACINNVYLVTAILLGFVRRRINNQLDADKLRFIDVISSTYLHLVGYLFSSS
jgi:hypothetical protein